MRLPLFGRRRRELEEQVEELRRKHLNTSLALTRKMEEWNLAYAELQAASYRIERDVERIASLQAEVVETTLDKKRIHDECQCAKVTWSKPYDAIEAHKKLIEMCDLPAHRPGYQPIQTRLPGPTDFLGGA